MKNVESITRECDIYEIMEKLKDDFFCHDFDRRALAKKVSQFGCCLAGYESGELVGFVGYYANDTKNMTGYLTTIVVAKKYQGQGVGSFLLHECLDDCRKKGMETCRLEVNKENDRAIQFYESKGFKKESRASEVSDYYIYRF